MSRQCADCSIRGQTWAGDPPKCCFSGGRFDPSGWNCATANSIRDLVHEFDGHPLVDFRYCDDQKYAVIDLHQCEHVDALAMWVTWYKNRGRTEAMWLLNSDNPPAAPTEQDCIRILAYAQSVRPFGET